MGKGQVLKHMAIARKVNDFLQSGAPEASPVRVHAARMEAWLATLETQLSASMPRVFKTNLPDPAVVYRWARELSGTALSQLADDRLNHGVMTTPTAFQVERAVLLALVTGCYVPPCRLHILKTVIHPRWAGPETGRLGGKTV